MHLHSTLINAQLKQLIALIGAGRIEFVTEGGIVVAAIPLSYGDLEVKGDALRFKALEGLIEEEALPTKMMLFNEEGEALLTIRVGENLTLTGEAPILGGQLIIEELIIRYDGS